MSNEKNVIWQCGYHLIYIKKNRVNNAESTCILHEYYFEFTKRASSYPFIFILEESYYACALCKDCVTNLTFWQNHHLNLKEGSHGFTYNLSLRTLFDEILENQWFLSHRHEFVFTVDEKEIIDFQYRYEYFLTINNCNFSLNPHKFPLFPSIKQGENESVVLRVWVGLTYTTVIVLWWSV